MHGTKIGEDEKITSFVGEERQHELAKIARILRTSE